MTRLAITAAVAFVLGGVLYAISMRGQTPELKRARWTKYWIYLLIILMAIVCAIAGSLALTIVVLGVCVIGGLEIHRARRAAARAGGAVPGGVWLVYIPVAGLASAGVALSSPERVTFVFAVVAAFDGACQVSGQLLGRRKLAPRLSPNKTVEGFLGGLALATLVAMILRDMVPASTAKVLIAAPVMAATALSGDLSKSWIKRRAGIKDFSTMIPGHGGVLDRFDGFLPNCALLIPLNLIEYAAS